MIKVKTMLSEGDSMEKSHLVFNLEIYSIGMRYDDRFRKRHMRKIKSVAKALRERLNTTLPLRTKDKTMEHSEAVEEISKRIIGMTVDSARDQLSQSGWTLRLVSVDGKNCVGTCDLRRERINARSEAGRITEYVSNG